MRQKVEIITYLDEDTSQTRRGLTVDGVLFDWTMATNSETELRSRMADASTVQAIEAETMRAFLRHFGEFLGREITIREVNEAIKNGWIEEET